MQKTPNTIKTVAGMLRIIRQRVCVFCTLRTPQKMQMPLLRLSRLIAREMEVGSSSLLVTKVGDRRIGIPRWSEPPPAVGSRRVPGHVTVDVAGAEHAPLRCVFEGVFTRSSTATSRMGAPLAPGALAGLVLPSRGQQPVAPMAGGMPALEGAAGGLELLLVGIRMGLAAVQAAQVAHHARAPLLHYGSAQRAVLGEEHGQSVGVHTSALWATRR